jgi:hypothetical protein
MRRPKLQVKRPSPVTIVVGAVGIFIGFLATAALIVTLLSYPAMLVLGALHSSHGLSAIPALGLWQTVGVGYILTLIGSRFYPSTTKG